MATQNDHKVGFIGLGNMGGPMVANLCAKGFSVRAFDLSAAALKRAVAAGCDPANNAVEAVADATIVLTMLPTGEAVEGLLIDDLRVLEAMPKGALLIDLRGRGVAALRPCDQQPPGESAIIICIAVL